MACGNYILTYITSVPFPTWSTSTSVFVGQIVTDGLVKTGRTVALIVIWNRWNITERSLWECFVLVEAELKVTSEINCKIWNDCPNKTGHCSTDDVLYYAIWDNSSKSLLELVISDPAFTTLNDRCTELSLILKIAPHRDHVHVRPYIFDNYFNCSYLLINFTNYRYFLFKGLRDVLTSVSNICMLHMITYVTEIVFIVVTIEFAVRYQIRALHVYFSKTLGLVRLLDFEFEKSILSKNVHTNHLRMQLIP